MKKVELQAVTSTKTAVTLSTVTAMMELLALVAVSVFATLDVGTRSSYLKRQYPANRAEVRSENNPHLSYICP